MGLHVARTLAAKYYYVTLDDGRKGYILAADLAGHVMHVDGESGGRLQTSRQSPHRHVGEAGRSNMLGKPDHVNRSETAGVIFDQYVYDSSRYVYIRNGVVTSIQTSGTLR